MSGVIILKMYCGNPVYYENREMVENNQNKLNGIDSKPTYLHRTYQTTSEFSHNTNNNTML